MEHYNSIIIGGGQAGLAVGYYLKKRQIKFVILEVSDRIGESWSARYDSLKLFTFSRYNNLPGIEFPGNKDRFPTKDEVADYLDMYALSLELPVTLNCKVLSVEKNVEGFLVTTSDNTLQASNVIVATGPFHTPFIPPFGKKLSSSVLQIHSSQYRNPGQLQAGDTLVVGAGNSGVQIVEELVATNRNVYFSFSDKLKRMPNNALIQRLIFGSGLTSLSKHSFLGSIVHNRPEPIMGTDLKGLFAKSNLTLLPRATDADGKAIVFGQTKVDSISNVVWATGFVPNFTWIKLDLFDKQGYPVHRRGVTSEKGLFFLGLAWMHSRNSGLLGGVKDDAKYVASLIQ